MNNYKHRPQGESQNISRSRWLSFDGKLFFYKKIFWGLLALSSSTLLQAMESSRESELIAQKHKDTETMDSFLSMSPEETKNYKEQQRKAEEREKEREMEIFAKKIQEDHKDLAKQAKLHMEQRKEQRKLLEKQREQPKAVKSADDSGSAGHYLTNYFNMFI